MGASTGHTVADGPATIPLHARDGSVRAHALVDQADLPLVEGHRWHLHAEGYVATNVGGRRNRRIIYLHRLLLGLEPGDGKQADHIHGNKLDNRRAKLRATDRGGNAQNVLAPRSRSGYRGVTWHKGHRKWMAHGRLNGRHHTLGYCDDPAEAAQIAADWRAEHMPLSAEAGA